MDPLLALDHQTPPGLPPSLVFFLIPNTSYPLGQLWITSERHLTSLSTTWPASKKKEPLLFKPSMKRGHIPDQALQRGGGGEKSVTLTMSITPEDMPGFLSPLPPRGIPHTQAAFSRTQAPPKTYLPVHPRAPTTLGLGSFCFFYLFFLMHLMHWD